MRLLPFKVTACICIALAGCFSTKGVRESPAARETFISTKSAELLAGCIADAWSSDHPGVKTNRTARGWSVIIENDMNTYAIADVTAGEGQAVVTYSTPIAGMARSQVPLIRACL